MLPSRLDGDPRLEALRSVLLEQERAALAALQQKFDDPQQFAEAVSAVLASAFALAETRDERLAAVLAPTMERGDAGVDPQGSRAPWSASSTRSMGPAIRKSIAETLDGTLRGLNQAFKHSLSWRGLKWRLEAYRSGSSFADVVLKHTVVFRVEHLFLIHRKTGLLLEHVAAPRRRRRIRSWCPACSRPSRISCATRSAETGRSSGAGGIDSVRLGDLLLWCEEGPFAFLAAVIRGNPPETLHARPARHARPHSRRAAHRRSRNSTATARPWAIWPRASKPACSNRSSRARKALSPWLWALPLALLLLVGVWLVQRGVEEHRVEAYVQRLRNCPAWSSPAAERRDGKWHVSGLRDPLAADPAGLLAQSEPGSGARRRPLGALSGAESGDRAQAPDRESQPSARRRAFRWTATPSAPVGSAPQHWVDKARALIAALPAGSPAIDLTAPQGHSGSDLRPPARRHPGARHQLRHERAAARTGSGASSMPSPRELSELIRVAKDLGFSVRVMIVGHADATGRETVESRPERRARRGRALDAARARASRPTCCWCAAPARSNPQQTEPRVGQDPRQSNRRVTFTVSTSD